MRNTEEYQTSYKDNDASNSVRDYFGANEREFVANSYNYHFFHGSFIREASESTTFTSYPSGVTWCSSVWS